MAEGGQIEEMVTAPLGALEDLFRAAAEALRQGGKQLNQTAQRSGLPEVPQVPELPKVLAALCGWASRW